MSRKLLFRSKMNSNMVSAWHDEIYINQTKYNGISLFYRLDGESKYWSKAQKNIHTPKQFIDGFYRAYYECTGDSGSVSLEEDIIPALFKIMPNFSMACLKYAEIEYGWNEKNEKDEPGFQLLDYGPIELTPIDKYELLSELVWKSNFDLTNKLEKDKERFDKIYFAAIEAFKLNPLKPKLPKRIGRLNIEWATEYLPKKKLVGDKFKKIHMANLIEEIILSTTITPTNETAKKIEFLSQLRQPQGRAKAYGIKNSLKQKVRDYVAKFYETQGKFPTGQKKFKDCLVEFPEIN